VGVMPTTISRPVAAATWPADRPKVQVPAEDGNTCGDLFFRGGEAGLVGEIWSSAVTGRRNRPRS
jgi:hypothetical protein